MNRSSANIFCPGNVVWFLHLLNIFKCNSDLILSWIPVILFDQFNPLYGSNSQSKNGLYFPNFMYFSTYFPIFYDIFSQREGKGSFPKSQIKTLDTNTIDPDQTVPLAAV